MNRNIKLVTLSVGAIIALTACDAAHQNGADISPSNMDELKNAVVIKLPDGFRNVVRGCDGKNAVYVTSRGGGTGNESTTIPSSIYVVPNSSLCGGTN